MIIALDYDGTYTAHPVLWDTFLKSSKDLGISVICCTMRYDNHEAEIVRQDLQGKVDTIIFTGRVNKRQALADKDIFPSIWIDDMPHFIFTDAHPN